MAIKATSILGLGIDIFVMKGGIKNTSSEFQQLNTSLKSTARGLEVVQQNLRNTALVVAGVLVPAFFGLVKVLKLSADEYITQDAILKDLQRITGATDSSISGLNKRFLELSSTLPLSAQELAKVSVELARMGIRGEGALTKGALTASKLATASVLSESEAALAIGRLSIVFGKDLESSADGIASAILKVATTTAATAEDVATATQRMGGMARQMGITIPETMALAGTLKNLGERSTVAATQMVRFMVLMSTRSSDISKFLGVTKDAYVDMLNKQPVEIFLKTLEKLGTLSRIDLGNGLVSLGISASRAQRAFMGLVPNVGFLRNEIKIVTKAFEDAIEVHRQYEIMARSLQARLQVLVGTLRNFGIIIGEVMGAAIRPFLEISIQVMSVIIALPTPILWVAGAALILVTAFTFLAAATSVIVAIMAWARLSFARLFMQLGLNTVAIDIMTGKTSLLALAKATLGGILLGLVGALSTYAASLGHTTTALWLDIIAANVLNGTMTVQMGIVATLGIIMGAFWMTLSKVAASLKMTAVAGWLANKSLIGMQVATMGLKLVLWEFFLISLVAIATIYLIVKAVKYLAGQAKAALDMLYFLALPLVWSFQVLKEVVTGLFKPFKYFFKAMKPVAQVTSDFMKSIRLMFKSVSAGFPVLRNVIRLVGDFIGLMFGLPIGMVVFGIKSIANAFKTASKSIDSEWLTSIINAVIHSFNGLIDAWNEMADVWNPLLRGLADGMGYAEGEAKGFVSILEAGILVVAGVFEVLIYLAKGVVDIFKWIGEHDFAIFAMMTVGITLLIVAVKMLWASFAMIMVPILSFVWSVAAGILAITWPIFAVVAVLMFLFWIFVKIKEFIFGSSFLHIAEGLQVIFKVFGKFIDLLSTIFGLFKAIGDIFSSLFGGGSSPEMAVDPTIIMGNAVVAIAGFGATAAPNVNFGPEGVATSTTTGVSGGKGSSSAPSQSQGDSGGGSGDIIIKMPVILDGQLLYEVVKRISRKDSLRRHVESGGDHPAIGAWA